VCALIAAKIYTAYGSQWISSCSVDRDKGAAMRDELSQIAAPRRDRLQGHAHRLHRVTVDNTVTVV